MYAVRWEVSQLNRQQIKKWSLLRHLNFKGYKRTASGNPLNMVKVMSPSQLTIYGNAVQDGTPSPDAPVEVQLCGDRTGNLLSMIDANPNSIPVKSYSNGIIEVIGEVSLSGGRTNRLSDYITLETNQTYTMVSYLVAGQTDSNIYVCLSRREDGTIYKSIEISAEKRFITIAPDENVELYLGINVTQGNRNSTLRVAIYKGSYTADTLPAYEPYGYKVSGRVEGVNLFDKDNASVVKGAVMKTTLEFIGESDGVYSYMRCDPNTTYTINKLPQSGIVCTANQIPATGAVANSRISAVEEGMELSLITVTTGNNDTYLWIALIPSTGGEYTAEEMLDSLQVLKGTYTATTILPYEPYQPPQDFAVYLPEQIAKVGDVADEVVVDMEKQTAELKKNVGSVVADGDESWMRGGTQYDSVDYTNRYSIFGDIHGNYLTPGYFSNRFERKLSDIWNNPNSEAFNINNNQLHLSISNTRLGITADDESADRTTKFKAWLNDNNVTVYAPLATPVTTDITSLQQWDAMPNIEGTVSITFDSAIPISNAETEYYSKEYDAI